MWIIRSGADKKNCVAVDEACNGSDINLVRWSRAFNKVYLNLEVVASFAEGSMGGLRKDSGWKVSTLSKHHLC